MNVTNLKHSKRVLENREERKAFNENPYENFQVYVDNNYEWLMRAYELERVRRFRDEPFYI
jgi:hypothetical protein